MHPQIQNQSNANLPARNKIAKDFWGIDAFSIDSRRGLRLQGDSYFRYYEGQFRLATHNGRQFRSAGTYENLVHIIKQLRDEGLDREPTREGLRKRLQMDGWGGNSWQTVSTDGSAITDDPDEVLDEVINLALRVWLMMPIGGFRRVCGPERVLEWSDGSVRAFLIQQFPKQHDLKESVALEKVFHARNLKRLGGIRIIWTNNLADHLRLQDDDTKVSIFHHATFLLYCKSW
jgi:hypothetical protein